MRGFLTKTAGVDMSAITYPASLPCPSSAPLQWAERRQLSSLPGPRGSRVLFTDQLGSQSLEFILRSEAQVQAWVDWVRDTLVDGAAWFAASWSQPQGGIGVRRFIGAPSYPEYLPVINAWRVSALCEVRGRGELPVMAGSIDTIINLSAESGAGADVGVTSAVGVVLTGLNPAIVYSLSLPFGQLHTAWSAYSSDGAAPGGLAWRNNFYVTTGDLPYADKDDVRSTMFGIEALYINAETARAAFPSGETITGFDTYTFWLYDANAFDDRGGLSIRVLG